MAYLVALQGGFLVALLGGSLVALLGGSLVALQGGSLVALHGGSLAERPDEVCGGVASANARGRTGILHHHSNSIPTLLHSTQLPRKEDCQFERFSFHFIFSNF